MFGFAVSCSLVQTSLELAILLPQSLNDVVCHNVKVNKVGFFFVGLLVWFFWFFFFVCFLAWHILCGCNQMVADIYVGLLLVP